MDQEEQPSGSLIRYKSPTFRKSETQLLLKLIDKYKNPLLIKSALYSVTCSKDKAWAELTREFNTLNTEYNYERTTEVLKTKWDNLKRLARKSSKNLESGDEPFHSEIVRNVILICGADVGPIVEAESDEGTDHKFNTSSFDSKDELNDSDGENQKTKAASIFSARDCRLLLHCVRQEKNVLFSNSPLVRKQKAWSRVARAFNRQSPSKRSPPELKKKFQNLKSMATRVNKNTKKCFTTIKRGKYEELSDDGLNKKIKSEPKSDATDADASDYDYDNGDDDDEDGLDAVLGYNSSIQTDVNHDPLSNGVSADSGVGLSNQSENKEVNKLKMELLNYELATAKLQRKRIEDAIEAEKSERDLRTLETSLRIRAARLEVLAAESKIPPLHPVLIYTPEETRAQQYLSYRIT